VVVGSIEVVRCSTRSEPGRLEQAYPDVARRWTPYREVYPGSSRARAGGSPSRVPPQISDTTLLVDAGVGRPGLPHVGGARGCPARSATRRDARGRRRRLPHPPAHRPHRLGDGREHDVLFPNARYLVHREASRLLQSQTARIRRCVEPLVDPDLGATRARSGLTASSRQGTTGAWAWVAPTATRR
jgi:hypothetical protein